MPEEITKIAETFTSIDEIGKSHKTLLKKVLSSKKYFGTVSVNRSFFCFNLCHD